jgi:hypothetical protein
MRRRFYSIVGVLLIVAAIAGLAISVIGISGIWRIERSIVTNLKTTLDLLDTTLQTTADGITLAELSLDQASSSLNTLVDTIETTGKSVHDTIPLVESLTQVTTQDVPGTIAQTQVALQSAQASAQVIDTTLSIITSIPFLTIAPYSNQKPLADALKDVSSSLDPISASLSSLETTLNASVDNLSGMEKQLTQIAVDIRAINRSVTDAKTVTSQYLTQVATLQTQLDLARNRLPGALNAIAWFITVALIWLGFTQIGLIMQGLEMMGLNFNRPKDPSTSAPAG